MMKIQSKGIANKSTKGEILDVFFSYIEFEDKQIINNIPDLKNSYQEIIERFERKINDPRIAKTGKYSAKIIKEPVLSLWVCLIYFSLGSSL